jgi:hypothetical protein
MILRTQQNIKQLVPEATPIAINKIANMMKDGRAAKRKEIEAQSPEFWGRLTKRIDEAGITAEYKFLNLLAAKDQVCVGMKRGLMGDLTGTYTWMLFPLLNPGTTRLSNVVALEAFNIQEKAKENEEQTKEDIYSETEEETNQNPDQEQKPATTGATYFFRASGRKEYSQNKDEDLTGKLDSFIKNINRSMIEINFRREPIYLTEGQLESSKYTQYRFAMAKILSLKTLRNQFIGRVFHSTQEQWKTDVASLLAFNTKSIDDSERWSKGDQ